MAVGGRAPAWPLPAPRASELANAHAHLQMRCDALGAFANALREFANALAFELRKWPLAAAAALPAACSHQPAAAGHYAARFRPHIYKCALCPFLCPKRPISQTTGGRRASYIFENPSIRRLDVAAVAVAAVRRVVHWSPYPADSENGCQPPARHALHHSCRYVAREPSSPRER